MNICFIVTNYNNTAYTKKLCESIKSCSISSCFVNVVVVDNASNIEEVEPLKNLESLFDFLEVIYNEENLGYFSGLNTGLKSIDQTKYDYVIVGNNDLSFDNSFFNSLFSLSEKSKRYPVLCPDIITLDGLHQNPHVISEISFLREILFDINYSNYYLSLFMVYVNSKLKMLLERKDYKEYKKSMEIYQGYGACYILTPLFFKNFEELWAPTFLMGEEFFLWKQLKDKGFNLYYDHSIPVKHVDHGSVAKIPSRYFWEIKRASHRVYREYVGWLGIRKGDDK